MDTILDSGEISVKTSSLVYLPPTPHTYVFSYSGPIQAGAEKLGICGSVRGRLGTLGRGTLARLLVNDLPGRSQRRWMAEKENVKSIKEKEKKQRQ